MIPILGAGLAGLSAAHNLKENYIVLEKDAKVGGLCKSVSVDGYVFDYAPHILFTRDEYIRTLFEELLEGNLLKHNREAFIYLQGVFARYPFEVNLHNLPEDVIQECIDGVVNKEDIDAKNFEEWIYDPLQPKDLEVRPVQD
jgi:UDP-galactopyranose mutase